MYIIFYSCIMEYGSPSSRCPSQCIIFNIFNIFNDFALESKRQQPPEVYCIRTVSKFLFRVTLALVSIQFAMIVTRIARSGRDVALNANNNLSRIAVGKLPPLATLQTHGAQLHMHSALRKYKRIHRSSYVIYTTFFLSFFRLDRYND